ncbi:MAG: response regulator transcription factor [Schleiferiaceae bacterium]|nr:response regulator transcription factor [Schleiferiaceae bacterium]
MNILIIEDEPSVMRFVKQGLEDDGHHVTTAADGEKGLQIASSKRFDAIVLDVRLPKMDGIEVCQKIRAGSFENTVPIIMLTAMSDTEDIIKGLDSGADDYLPKPFKFSELYARLRALNRRNHADYNEEEKELLYNTLHINLEMKEVTREGQLIKLTAREFFLLEFFVRQPEKVHSRAFILEKVWGIQHELNTNVVDVYMNFLRNKIDKPFEKKLLHTIIGMGYSMRAEL